MFFSPFPTLPLPRNSPFLIMYLFCRFFKSDFGPHGSKDDAAAPWPWGGRDEIGRGNKPHINYFIVLCLLPDLKDPGTPPDLGADFHTEKQRDCFPHRQKYGLVLFFLESYEGATYKARGRKITEMDWSFILALKLFSSLQSNFF